MASKKRTTRGTSHSETTPPAGGLSEITDAGLETLISQHAPAKRQPAPSLVELRKAIRDGKPMDMVVLAGDIRRSTFIMKEAVDFKRFAQIIGGFVGAAAKAVKQLGGWFDKFTGDGFLAYWFVSKNDSKIGEVFTACHSLLHAFKGDVLDDLRKNSKNFPDGVGLSLGIDAGPTHPVIVAGDLTVVGSTVVGAVRMVNAASSPWETIANVYLGEALYRRRGELLQEYQVEVTREFRATKEYGAQEVYPIRFLKVPI